MRNEPQDGFDQFTATPEDWAEYAQYLDETEGDLYPSQEFDDYLDYLDMQEQMRHELGVRPVYIHASEMMQPTPWSE